VGSGCGVYCSAGGGETPAYAIRPGLLKKSRQGLNDSGIAGCDGRKWLRGSIVM